MGVLKCPVNINFTEVVVFIEETISATLGLSLFAGPGGRRWRCPVLCPGQEQTFLFWKFSWQLNAPYPSSSPMPSPRT